MNGGEERAGVRRGRSLQRSTMGRVALSSVCCNSVRSDCAPAPARGERAAAAGKRLPPIRSTPRNMVRCTAGDARAMSRAMTCKSKRATTGEDRMSGRSSSWRLQPSACAPSLPRSKRAGARPSKSHFNPTLSHFVPSHFPSHFAARIPRNPAESRRFRRPSVLCPVSRDNPTSGPVQWPRRGVLAPAQCGGPHDTPRETVAIHSGRTGR